jgi:hypothetical protein
LVKAENIAGQPMNGEQVGFSGCGKKAVYIYVDGAGFVNNTGVQQDAAQLAPK